MSGVCDITVVRLIPLRFDLFATLPVIRLRKHVASVGGGAPAGAAIKYDPQGPTARREVV